jgi:copper homeostasis protein
MIRCTGPSGRSRSELDWAPVLIEVIAETVEDAREAEQGGAGRIELVRDLARGGLTPAIATIEAVVRAVKIPVRVMLRDSEPFELTDPGEPRRLHATALAAHEHGAAGFVAGFVAGGLPSLRALQEILGSLDAPLTFHRAFEALERQVDAMAMLSGDARIDRILTSGGPGPWREKIARLGALQRAAPQGLRILPGGGVDGEVIRQLAGSGFAEAHVGTAARVPAGAAGRVSASRVAALVAIATSTWAEDP